MKNILKVIAIVLLLIPALSKAQGDCKSEEYEDKCVNQLFDIFDDYLYLRSRVISYNDDNIMYGVNLKRNLLYIFNVCSESGKDDVIINLYDQNDKLIGSSINAKTKLNDKIICFKPEKSGKYYVSTVTRNKYKDCSLMLFGLIKTNITHYLPGH